jgi:hypothetical protein
MEKAMMNPTLIRQTISMTTGRRESNWTRSNGFVLPLRKVGIGSGTDVTGSGLHDDEMIGSESVGEYLPRSYISPASDETLPF